VTRILVLGASGMLGHKLFQRASGEFETFGTVRRWNPAWGSLAILDRARLRVVDASNFAAVEQVIDSVQPDWIVNCIGIVKQRPESQDKAISMLINTELPGVVDQVARSRGARLIHISTDCVFSGRAGDYRESDRPDPTDLYGETKRAGEVAARDAIILRTSLIGREIATGSSLVEWFLRNQSRSVSGFRRAIFSGLTTITMADEIKRIISDASLAPGLYHVSEDPIDKYSLLRMLGEAYHTTVQVSPEDSFQIDRSLNSERYRGATGFRPRPWPALIAEMMADKTPYDRLDLERD